MKTSQKSIFALLSLALAFSACQKDGLVDRDLLAGNDISIDNQQPDYETDARIPDPLNASTAAFQIEQKVLIQRPDCDLGPALKKDEENSRRSSNGCYGKYNLSSRDGRGWVEEIGSFTSIVDLEYDPMSKEINGTVILEMDGEQSNIVLKAMGSIESQSSPSESTTLMVKLESGKGSGSSGLPNFEGQIYISNAEEVFSERSSVDYSVILITGYFGIEVRGPVQ
jgi:hypothetical protein